MIASMTVELGLRLLKLQEEFANRHDAAGAAQEFGRAEWSPRTEAEIATEYEATIREMLTTA